MGGWVIDGATSCTVSGDVCGQTGFLTQTYTKMTTNTNVESCPVAYGKTRDSQTVCQTAVCPNSDTCGSSQGVYSTTEAGLTSSPNNGKTLCSTGSASAVLNNGNAGWSWRCGTNSCTAFKPGCNDPFNTNYDPNGAANTYNCSSSCSGNRIWDAAASGGAGACVETCNNPVSYTDTSLAFCAGACPSGKRLTTTSLSCKSGGGATIWSPWKDTDGSCRGATCTPTCSCSDVTTCGAQTVCWNGTCPVSGVCPVKNCDNGGLTGASCASGSWTAPAACPTLPRCDRSSSSVISPTSENCRDSLYCSGAKPASVTCPASIKCQTVDIRVGLVSSSFGSKVKDTHLSYRDTGYVRELEWKSNLNDPLASAGRSCTATGDWGLTAPKEFGGKGNTNTLSTNASFTYACRNQQGADGGSSSATANVIICPITTPVWVDPQFGTGLAVCQAGPSDPTKFALEYNYIPNATFKMTCNRNLANKYYLERSFDSGTSYALFSQGDLDGSGNASVSVNQKALYRLKCKQVSTDDEEYLSGPHSIIWKYDNVPPPPLVSLTATPATIVKGAKTALSWDVTYPNPVQTKPNQGVMKLGVAAACTLTVTPICPVGNCSEALSEATRIQTIINASTTDENDINIARPITPTALNHVVDGGDYESKTSPQTGPGIPPGDTNWKALGKKTFILNNSMNFELQCGTGQNEYRNVRVMVTSSNEG